ncbi:hypothetical protein PENTCL1PPCAC_21892, partial [Pristionchus entomophagus]
NIRDNVYFDLKKGIYTFIDKSDTDDIQKKDGLHSLCTWACAQKGDDLKQICSGAQFAAHRRTMKLIASTIWTHGTYHQIVKFMKSPMEEAMDLLTPEFKKKFNLKDSETPLPLASHVLIL